MHQESTAGARTVPERAAVERDPLAHAQEAVPGTRRRDRSPPSSATSTSSWSSLHRSSTRALAGPACLMTFVRAFLHDPVGDEVEPEAIGEASLPSRLRQAHRRPARTPGAHRAGRGRAAERGRLRRTRPSGCRSAVASPRDRHDPSSRSGRSPSSRRRGHGRRWSEPHRPARPSRSWRAHDVVELARSSPAPPRRHHRPPARDRRRCGVVGCTRCASPARQPHREGRRDRHLDPVRPAVSEQLTGDGSAGRDRHHGTTEALTRGGQLRVGRDPDCEDKVEPRGRRRQRAGDHKHGYEREG